MECIVIARLLVRDEAYKKISILFSRAQSHKISGWSPKKKNHLRKEWEYLILECSLNSREALYLVLAIESWLS